MCIKNTYIVHIRYFCGLGGVGGSYPYTTINADFLRIHNFIFYKTFKIFSYLCISLFGSKLSNFHSHIVTRFPWDSVLRILYRGSYMSAHVLLNLLNELGKVIKCEACREFYYFFATSLINSIIQEHEC